MIAPAMTTALVGLATVLTVLTLVWVLSLRLRDASIAPLSVTWNDLVDGSRWSKSI